MGRGILISLVDQSFIDLGVTHRSAPRYTSPALAQSKLRATRKRQSRTSLPISGDGEMLPSASTAASRQHRMLLSARRWSGLGDSGANSAAPSSAISSEPKVSGCRSALLDGTGCRAGGGQAATAAVMGAAAEAVVGGATVGTAEAGRAVTPTVEDADALGRGNNSICKNQKPASGTGCREQAEYGDILLPTCIVYRLACPWTVLIF